MDAIDKAAAELRDMLRDLQSAYEDEDVALLLHHADALMAAVRSELAEQRRIQDAAVDVCLQDQDELLSRVREEAAAGAVAACVERLDANCPPSCPICTNDVDGFVSMVERPTRDGKCWRCTECHYAAEGDAALLLELQGAAEDIRIGGEYLGEPAKALARALDVAREEGRQAGHAQAWAAAEELIEQCAGIPLPHAPEAPRVLGSVLEAFAEARYDLAGTIARLAPHRAAAAIETESEQGGGE
jgi:hypothetical protein